MSQTKASNSIKQTALTPHEKEVVVACLLGDGTLSQAGKNYRLRVEHQEAHKEYVEWKHSLLQRLCVTPVQKVSAHSSYRFGTVGHPEITQMRQIWYQNSKQVVADMELTPLMTAIWFMDDGTKHRDTVDISVHNFSEVSIEALRKNLLKFGVNTTVNSDSKGLRLYVKKESYPNFKNLVKPYIVKCMAYKLP